MSTYKGTPSVVARPAQEIADLFADLRSFQPKLDALPAERREQLKGLTLNQDSLEFDVNMVGRVTLAVEERTPQRVSFAAQGIPMPLQLRMDMEETAEGTQLTPVIDLEVPFMLRAMIGPQIQKAVDQVGAYIGELAK